MGGKRIVYVGDGCQKRNINLGIEDTMQPKKVPTKRRRGKRGGKNRRRNKLPTIAPTIIPHSLKVPQFSDERQLEVFEAVRKDDYETVRNMTEGYSVMTWNLALWILEANAHECLRRLLTARKGAALELHDAIITQIMTQSVSKPIIRIASGNCRHFTLEQLINFIDGRENISEREKSAFRTALL